MPLLNDPNKVKDDEDKPVSQPTQPAQQPSQSVTSASQQQPAPAQPQRKGTGFTNLNRIMQANQGNRLGQTVAGGVSGAAQGLQSGISQSQNRFTQAAEKARLDTPEAAAKRDAVLGRFDENNYNVDQSKFQMNQGLVQDYETKKAAQQKALEAQKAAGQSQSALVQKQIQDAQARKAALQSAPAPQFGSLDLHDNSTTLITPEQQMANFVNKNKKQIAGIDAGLGTLQNILAATNASSATAEKKIQDQLADYESQFGKLTDAERAKWVQSEKDRMVAENMPNEDEMREFQKYQSGAYGGPRELEDFQTLLGKGQQTEQLGQLARSTGGRQELLKQFVGGRDYTAGQRGLDEAILGQDKSSLLSQAAKQTRGAERDVTSANKLAGAKALDYVSKAKEFGDQTRARIDETKSGLSSRISQQLDSLKSQEAQKEQDFGTIQGILSGTDPQYKNLGAMDRTGLALQLAQNAGYINDQEARALVSSGGIVKRAGEMGVDLNKLLAERFKQTKALGIDEQAAATSDQEKRMQALDKLLGKTGTDVAFSGKEQYQAGKVGLDFDSLAQEIAREEQARLQSDTGFSQKMQQQKLSPLQQILAGTMQAGQAIQGGVGGNVLGAAGLYGGASAAAGGLGLGAGGAGLTAGGAMMGAAPYAAAAMLASDLLTGGDSTAQAMEGATAAGAGVGRLGADTQSKILEGMAKLNIGGVSLDKLSGGNLQKLNEYTNKLQNQGIGEAAQMQATTAQGLRDLTQGGKMDQALAKISGFDTQKRIVENAGKTVSKALFGGETGNWKPAEYNTVDATTGKKVKIGDFASKSSDDILKQMLSQSELNRATSLGAGQGKQGAKVVNELLKYYNAALKREGKA